MRPGFRLTVDRSRRLLPAGVAQLAERIQEWGRRFDSVQVHYYFTKCWCRLGVCGSTGQTGKVGRGFARESSPRRLIIREISQMSMSLATVRLFAVGVIASCMILSRVVPMGSTTIGHTLGIGEENSSFVPAPTQGKNSAPVTWR